MGSWPELKELALVGFAIGGWDLLVRGRGPARLRWVGLGMIDLLDGTFTHRQSAVSRPDGPSPLLKSMTQQSFLCRIESYVACGGRHPSLSPGCDPDTALWWFEDLMPGNRLEKMKVFAREQGLCGGDLFCK